MYKLFAMIICIYGIVSSAIIALIYYITRTLPLGLIIFLSGVLIAWLLYFCFSAINDLIEKINKIAENTDKGTPKQDFPEGFASKEEYEKQIEFENMFK